MSSLPFYFCISFFNFFLSSYLSCPVSFLPSTELAHLLTQSTRTIYPYLHHPLRPVHTICTYPLCVLTPTYSHLLTPTHTIRTHLVHVLTPTHNTLTYPLPVLTGSPASAKLLRWLLRTGRSSLLWASGLPSHTPSLCSLLELVRHPHPSFLLEHSRMI